MSGATGFGAVLKFLRGPDVIGRLRLTGDLHGLVRLHWLGSAVDVGLLRALSKPSTRDELVQALSVQRDELLDVMLELGQALGELGERNGIYSLRGNRARTLATERGDAYAALLSENLDLHADAYRHIAGRLRGGNLGEYLEQFADVVARSSRIVEPFQLPYVRELAVELRPGRVLDVGCGSGIYVTVVAEAWDRANVTGIDVQPAAVHRAAATVLAANVRERCTILLADILKPPHELDSPFDLAMLNNNLYYFAPEEHVRLFRLLLERIRQEGTLSIVCLMRGVTLTALDLDLTLASTRGNYRLPLLKQVLADLSAAGFSGIRSSRLIPGQPLFAIRATRPS